MEGVSWLWLYDKRWMFGLKAPAVRKIWVGPLALNAFFLGSLLYYSFNYQDEFCYNTFKHWINIRIYILGALLLNLIYILLKASTKEDQKLKIFRKANQPKLAKKYNYWLRRKITVSGSGLCLLLLAIINWTWMLYGMELVYSEFYSISACEGFMQDIVWGNLGLTALFAFPIIWIIFWMVIIKGICLLLSILWPSALIWINKKRSS